MKVIFHEDFYQVYTSDPAAAAGRLEAVVAVIAPEVEFLTSEPASLEDIASVHTEALIESIKGQGLFPIAALAAGGAIQTATLGLTEPCFGLVRPPGHHASSGSCWGFCYFNNMAIALARLKRLGKIHSAYVLDIDLHFGDGTVNIL
jgi:acetoin utilization deacetylase AcuC-like enzyme